MSSLRPSLALRPGLGLGAYPERDPSTAREDDEGGFLGNVLKRPGGNTAELNQAVATIREYGESLQRMPDELLTMSATGLRMRFAQDSHDLDLAMQAFAHVREVSGRILGLYHHDTQLLGGWVMYNGKLAQMQTGEGKTLTATLPACAAAMAGIPVHVITANDYLAERDAETMMPVYERLGISVGVVREAMDTDERREAYACDVTYCTNKQIAFDYLRDRVARGAQTSALHTKLARIYDRPTQSAKLMLRGLCFAVVDEADSVLIDEARTPLILSQPVDDGPTDEPEKYRVALELADALEEKRDFQLDRRNGGALLTEAGLHRLDQLAASLTGALGARREREALVTQALMARHVYQRDCQYVVRDDRVQIVDDYTGRLMPDRSWGRGIQQLVETKEGCELSGHKQTLARISYQRFFGRYLRLSGMTGTANGLDDELAQVYGLEIVDIPTFKPSRRVGWAEEIYTSAMDKNTAIVQSAVSLAADGRAILIGTRSVLDSEQLGEQLRDAGADVQVLNARQDDKEASIVAAAGFPGRITVATNMAGRGTDIPLSPELKEVNGLHVIVASRNESARIDRQLVGRCARQGDPGSYQFFAALDDDIPVLRYAPWMRRLFAVLARPCGRMPRVIGAWLVNHAQNTLERKHRKMRYELQIRDQSLAQTLAFSGRAE